MKINICIVDDHPLILEGIEKVLKPFGHIHIAGSYSSGRALLDMLPAAEPDVILMDIQLPDYTDGSLIVILKKEFSHIPVIALTNINNPYMVKRMLAKGCAGYVLKTADNATLLSAIERVYEKQTFIDPAIKDELIHLFVGPPRSGEHGENVMLTSREKEILTLVGEGLTNTEISGRLFLSNRTIENHRFSIYRKFGVSNVAQLIKVALQRGYLS